METDTAEIQNLMRQSWATSARGNRTTHMGNLLVTVFARNGGWHWCYDGEWSPDTLATEADAMRDVAIHHICVRTLRTIAARGAAYTGRIGKRAVRPNGQPVWVLAA